MQLTGKIIHVLPEQTGTSKRGPWRKQEYVIETPGEYPKPVCFMVWGEKIDEFGIREGQELTVDIDLQSREYNGRWFTDVKAWRVQQSADASGNPDEPPLAEPRGYEDDFDDDVPF